MSRYEAHITIQPTKAQILNQAGPDFVDGLTKIAKDTGWKTSIYVGDPALDSVGVGSTMNDEQFAELTRFYLTGYGELYWEVEAAMVRVAKLATDAGYSVIRQKIEMEVFDWKRDPHG